MPNWCFNDVWVTGPKAELERFRKAVREDRKDGEAFSFQRVLPMPLEMLSGEEGMLVGTNTRWMTYQRSEEVFGATDWYNWQQFNYGVKWGASESEGWTTTKALRYRFNSPWGPIDPTQLLKLFPSLSIRIKYSEPGNFIAGDEFFGSSEEEPMEEWQAEYFRRFGQIPPKTKEEGCLTLLRKKQDIETQIRKMAWRGEVELLDREVPPLWTPQVRAVQDLGKKKTRLLEPGVPVLGFAMAGDITRDTTEWTFFPIIDRKHRSRRVTFAELSQGGVADISNCFDGGVDSTLLIDEGENGTKTTKVGYRGRFEYGTVFEPLTWVAEKGRNLEVTAVTEMVKKCQPFLSNGDERVDGQLTTQELFPVMFLEFRQKLACLWANREGVPVGFEQEDTVASALQKSGVVRKLVGETELLNDLRSFVEQTRVFLGNGLSL